MEKTPSSRFFLQDVRALRWEAGPCPLLWEHCSPAGAVPGLTVGAENVFFWGYVVSQVCEVKAL